MNQDADILFAYLRDVLYDPKCAKLDISALSPDFQKLGQGLQYFCQCINEASQFAADLSRGELNGQVPSSQNELASPLKNLHASLRHLTWQTQQVAKGDYQQRVDFMGEFSEAFNAMVAQLEQQRQALLAELDLSNQTVLEGQEEIRRLEGYAYQDNLTHTGNRYFGMQKLEELLDEDKNFCLCFIDLDNLKYVNDTYGHPEGDKYIVAAADLLKRTAPSAIVSRLGGDEFMLLLEDNSRQQAEDRLKAMQKLLTHEGENLPYERSISFGVVHTSEMNPATASEMLNEADERMYQRKRQMKARRRGRLASKNSSGKA